MTLIVVAFASRKGGVGKTSVALSVAALAAAAGKRTLLVDLDQEGHATFGIGADVNLPGSAKLLMGESVEPQHISDKLDVLSGNQELEDPAIGRLEPEALADVLKPLKYDFVAIDCPPNTHELQKLGVVAAKSVIIPIDAHPYALNCATRLIEDLKKRQSRDRPGAERWAVVANKIDLRRKLDRDAVDNAGSLFRDNPVFQLSQDTAIANSSTERVPITALSPAPRPETMKELRRILDWTLKQ